MRIVVKPAGAITIGGVLLAVITVALVQPFKASVAKNAELAPINGFAPSKKAGDSVFKAREALEPVNLTASGKRDWICWGVDSESAVNRKASGSEAISTFALVQSGKGIRGAGKRGPSRGFYWSDGKPKSSASVVYPGIHIGDNNGARFTVKAGDTKKHTLKVYVGGWKAGGDFSCFITDGSTLETRQENIALEGGYYCRIYTVNYTPTTDKEELKVVWKMARGTSSEGNVSLQAATLD